VIDKTILVLDENAASRTFLANILREKQFRVLEAPSGKEALIVAWRDNPDLILFDPVLSDIKDEEFITKIRTNSRTSRTPLVAISSDPGPMRKEVCINAGVNEFIVKSAQAVPALAEALTRLFNTETPAETASGDGSKKGLLIVFLSAKGGAGTSSLCANLAMNIQSLQPETRVVVADLVLPIGSVGQIVGYRGELDLTTVADLSSGQTNGEYFRENLPQPELWKFQLLAGSPDPQHGNELKGDRIAEVVDTLRTAFDFIILDIGRSLSRISLPLIKEADVITLIVSTDQSTVKLTKTVWEYLQSQGIENKRVYVILNRAVGLEGLTKSEAEAIIGLEIKKALPYMGSNFSLANNLNQPITIKYPTDTASIVLKETADDMLKVAHRLRAL
jgi:Flp pilus assembly CpaE family ATPase